ncbi:g-type lectin s-receptor-like serine/threonine-protein kinase [Quercus suber]|uniref:G-type lectin s-receptor-like serine/threonine-protein kinase n=1 Tax=Quercus suber TaxID=58331 RepID=A0AAW0L5I7_QUESU
MAFTWSASHISFCTIYTFLFLSSFSFCSARDTLTFRNPINDNQGESLVSAGKIFELGFFTPSGSSKHGRYVGIWNYKSSPMVVVWVANRIEPVSSKTTGAFTSSENGDLQLYKLDNDTAPASWSLTLMEPRDNCSVLMLVVPLAAAILRKVQCATA